SLILPQLPRSTLFPYTTLFRSKELMEYGRELQKNYYDKSLVTAYLSGDDFENTIEQYIDTNDIKMLAMVTYQRSFFERLFYPSIDRKSTRLNSSHVKISYAVFC